MQLLPDTGVVPVAQSPPAGHAAPEPQFLRQPLPGVAGVEHEQDAAQGLPVVQVFAPGRPDRALVDRQERLDPGPQAVIDNPWAMTAPLLRPALPSPHSKFNAPIQAGPGR
jgi:hypothetical protein